MTDFVTANKNAGIATLTFNRGKVNALNGQVVEEIRSTLAGFENDPDTKAIIITGIREAAAAASDLGAKPAYAFASIKSLLRKPVAEKMRNKEKDSINEFVEIWYSDATWANIKNIKIR